jgi:hypothetical protein
MAYSKEQQRFFALLVHALDLSADPDDLLYPLSSAIRGCINVIDGLPKNDSSPEVIWQIDDECDQIESLLGLCFVACQVYLTNIVSHCRHLHDFQERKSGNRQLAGHNGEKKELLQRCCIPIAGTSYTAITAIDAFANYFKHRDEWDYNWNSLKANALATATIIQSFGASSGSTGNLRQGYSRIVGDDFQQVLRFGDILREWAKALKAEYQRELSKLSTS